LWAALRAPQSVTADGGIGKSVSSSLEDPPRPLRAVRMARAMPLTRARGRQASLPAELVAAGSPAAASVAALPAPSLPPPSFPSAAPSALSSRAARQLLMIVTPATSPLMAAARSAGSPAAAVAARAPAPSVARGGGCCCRNSAASASAAAATSAASASPCVLTVQRNHGAGPREPTQAHVDVDRCETVKCLPVCPRVLSAAGRAKYTPARWPAAGRPPAHRGQLPACAPWGGGGSESSHPLPRGGCGRPALGRSVGGPCGVPRCSASSIRPFQL